MSSLHYRLAKRFHSYNTRLWRACDNLFAWPDVKKIANDIPPFLEGGVGGDSYTSWVYQQGFWGGLLSQQIAGENNNILDLACGEGKLATTCLKFAGKSGQYVGVDINEQAIQRCQRHFKDPRASFKLLKAGNDAYVKRDNTKVSIGARESFDLIISVSLFTHLKYEEALFYLREIHSALRKGGKAIITFHVHKDKYPVIPFSVKQRGTYDFQHPLDKKGWSTSDPTCPELSIAVNEAALKELLDAAGKWASFNMMQGSIMGSVSAFFQDIVILEKA